MNAKQENMSNLRKSLHEIAGEIGIVMSYVNATIQIKLSRDIKTMCENSVSSLYKIRDEINRMRGYIETVGSSDHGEK